jgi:hypothetical protein
VAHEPSADEQNNHAADLACLRDAVASASSPAAVGWQTQEWLDHREQLLNDVMDLLSPASIEAEMRIREDVPRLLAQLAAAVRGSGR